MRHPLLVSVLVAATVGPTAAQPAARCALRRDVATAPCDSVPTEASSLRRMAPRYPTILRQAGVVGEVHIR